jgi:thiol-disulfide isomerase/thioredoxin
MISSLRWFVGAAFALGAGAILFGFSSVAADAYHRELDVPLELLNPQIVTRELAPDFSLPDRQGRIHRLSALKGRPVLLNLWSSDCPPCIEELPSLAALEAVARQKGRFSVVTITIDESWEAIAPIFDGQEPPLTILFDGSRSVVEGRYKTKMFPETFIIDSDGYIRARFDGQRGWASPVVLNLLRNYE